MNYGHNTTYWKPSRWVRLDLILFNEGYIHQFQPEPLTKFTSSSRSTEFKNILSWNISEMITKTIPISTRIVISYAMKWGILFWVFWKVNGHWDNNIIRNSQWRESHYRITTGIRRKKEIQRSRTVRVTVRDARRKVNHLSKVIWDRKITTKCTRSISSTRIGEPMLMVDVKVSKDKHISWWVYWKNLIYFWWNRIKNCA